MMLFRERASCDGENPGLEGRETWGTRFQTVSSGDAACYNFGVAGIRFEAILRVIL